MPPGRCQADVPITITGGAGRSPAPPLFARRLAHYENLLQPRPDRRRSPSGPGRRLQAGRDQSAPVHLAVPEPFQREWHLSRLPQRRVDLRLLARRDLAGLRGHRRRAVQKSRPGAGGQLCRPHRAQSRGGPSRHGLSVQPLLRGCLEAGGQRKGPRRGHRRRRPAADPLPAQRPLPAGLGRHGRPRQLPLYHRLYAECPPAVLGHRSDRRREVPRHRRGPHRHLPGQLLPPRRQHLPHLLHEPRRHPQGRPHLPGL